MNNSLQESFRIYLLSEAGLSDLTVEAYIRDVRRFLIFMDRNNISTFDHNVVDNHIKSLTHLHQNSRHRACASIRSLYHFLSSKGLIDHQIIKLIDPIRKVKRKPHWLKPEEFKRIVDNIHGSASLRNIAIMKLIYGSGLRISELCNLDINSISEQNNTVRIWGKGAIERVAPVPHTVIDSLKKYKPWRERYVGLRQKALFISQQGNRVERREMSHMIERWAKQLNIKATAHTLRHSFATNLNRQLKYILD
jgi:site-specific recombinase XerD